MGAAFIRRLSEGVPFYEAFADTDFCMAAVTTREGGVSAAHLSSLNLGTHCGDSTENLTENFRRTGRAIGLMPENWVLTNQEHTNTVRRVYASDKGTGILSPRFPEGIDGILTNEAGVGLIAYFADCIPVLFCDPVKKAVAVCHSGWRGTVSKIAAETVSAMEREFGSRPGDIRAAIGPGIGACCFAVDEPVYAEFCRAFGKDGHTVRKENGKYYIDLAAAVEDALLSAGVREIGKAGICTACHSRTFFSHRATGGKRGCFAAIIYIRP